MYQYVWFVRVGEQLTCDREPGNRYDTFARAIKKVMLRGSCAKMYLHNLTHLKFE